MFCLFTKNSLQWKYSEKKTCSIYYRIIIIIYLNYIYIYYLYIYIIVGIRPERMGAHEECQLHGLCTWLGVDTPVMKFPSSKIKMWKTLDFHGFSCSWWSLYSFIGDGWCWNIVPKNWQLETLLKCWPPQPGLSCALPTHDSYTSTSSA
jgi:hypothetical protein